MSRTLERLAIGVITGPITTTIYTVPGATKVELRSWYLTTDAVTTDVSLRIVDGVNDGYLEAGPSPASRTRFVADSTWVVMYPGDELQLSIAAGADCFFIVTGIVLTPYP